MKTVTPVYSITPFTLLDYPDRTACILWFAGCNMRCSYCYNPDIVLGKGKLSINQTMDFLHSRKGILDGVVLSGGECTLHKHLIPVIKEIRSLGYVVKLDTNGCRPKVMKQILEEKLVDYVALDFKALPESFQSVTSSDLFAEFEETLMLLIKSTTCFELRTTVHADLIDEKDFRAMVCFLESKHYKGNYYVQHFVNQVPTLGNLGYSGKEFINKDFSTVHIQVVFR
ncbi:pyruvate formate lyase activating enzyme [Pedobacter steynii]|uniref:Pyruvate formate lyase activating enzyme n=1 Tax=Pedobacter steynii TaxID=430522 RepID=A0A1G9U6N3_9SPHI|nr:anaerobic ribonucleoside-triphosphate reductase activating protein [Pedobacter steynii]NQX40676.1 anaerobic ribonucleoside-triphosphate reductase activating protein [Pedobacter steynii]SDM55627.1 pyruvate formate lyase activating enzyme [Pedobacter steynii]